MHHYPFHVGDYTLATLHLEDRHDLCYRRLLDAYYLDNGPLADAKQTLSRRIRTDEQTLIEVLQEFFVLIDGYWHHSRCDIEISRFKSKSEKAKIAGLQGGRPKKSKRLADAKQTLSERKANQNQNQNHLNTPISPTEKPPASPSLGLEIEESKTLLTQDQIEIASWFNRRSTTPWSEKERKAWAKVSKPIDADDWRALQWFYTRSGCQYLRRDLLTLLNNWTGEIDRAKNYNPDSK